MTSIKYEVSPILRKTHACEGIFHSDGKIEVVTSNVKPIRLFHLYFSIINRTLYT